MATITHLFLITTVLFLTSAASPPYPTPQDHQHADRIIQAMIRAGNFRDWAADFLSTVDDQFGIPLHATIFIPTDFDSADVSFSSTGTTAKPGRLSVAYHVVPQRLSFADLRLLKPLSRLPTLLPEYSIVVTNSSVSEYTLDGVLVSEPDLFLSSSIAIHGVASSLDYSRYGDNGDGDTALIDSLRRRRRHSPPKHKKGKHHKEKSAPAPTDTNETSASAPTVHHSYRPFLLLLAVLALF